MGRECYVPGTVSAEHLYLMKSIPFSALRSLRKTMDAAVSRHFPALFGNILLIFWVFPIVLCLNVEKICAVSCRSRGFLGERRR